MIETPKASPFQSYQLHALAFARIHVRGRVVHYAQHVTVPLRSSCALFLHRCYEALVCGVRDTITPVAHTPYMQNENTTTDVLTVVARLSLRKPIMRKPIMRTSGQVPAQASGTVRGRIARDPTDRLRMHVAGPNGQGANLHDPRTHHGRCKEGAASLQRPNQV